MTPYIEVSFKQKKLFIYPPLFNRSFDKKKQPEVIDNYPFRIFNNSNNQKNAVEINYLMYKQNETPYCSLPLQI